MGQKTHQDSTVRFNTDKIWPERATKAVRFITARYGPEKVPKTRQYNLLWPRIGQKEPSRLGSIICYRQTWARKSHRDSTARFVTAKSWPERLTETRQYDLLWPRTGHQRFVTANRWRLKKPLRLGKKEPPRLGNTIYYGQIWARKSHRDSGVRFVMAKRGPERATKTRQDLLPPKVGLRDSAVRFITAKKKCPKSATKTRQYGLLRPKMGQKETQRLVKTQYELLRPRVGQKEPPRFRSTIYYSQTCGRKSNQDWAIELARKSHRDSVGRFVTAKRGPERATETRQYDLLRPDVGQKEPPRLGSTICCDQKWARKSHQDSAVRFVTAKSGPERATEIRKYDLLRPKVGQKEAPRLGNTICYGQEMATKTLQYDLLRPKVGQKKPPRLVSTICYSEGVGQKKPPRLGSTICCGQDLGRKSHQDPAI